MVACGAGVVKSGPGAKGLTFIILKGGVTAPVCLFFEQQKIVRLQKVRCAQSTYAPSNNYNLVARRNGRLGERVAVANLMANLVMIAVQLRHREILRGKERQIRRASGGHRTDHDEFQKISSSIAHECSPSREEGSKAAAAAGDSPVC